MATADPEREEHDLHRSQWEQGPNGPCLANQDCDQRRHTENCGDDDTAAHEASLHRIDFMFSDHRRTSETESVNDMLTCTASQSPAEKPEHHGAMMRRYRIWMAWSIGPLTAALIVLTVLAATTDFMRWPPLLAATVAAAVAGTISIALGPSVDRQQVRERRAQQNQRVR